MSSSVDSRIPARECGRVSSAQEKGLYYDIFVVVHDHVIDDRVIR